MMAADLGLSLATTADAGGAEDYFVADSFSFAVEREMSESGEEGEQAMILVHIPPVLGDASINTDGYDGSAPPLSLASEEAFAELGYKLDRCFVKSWTISGDADDAPTEEVAFYYNKIAMQYAQTVDGRNY